MKEACDPTNLRSGTGQKCFLIGVRLWSDQAQKRKSCFVADNTRLMRSLAPLLAADCQQLLQLQWKDKHIFKKERQRFDSWVLKRVISLFISFCSNHCVAKQVTCFCWQVGLPYLLEKWRSERYRRYYFKTYSKLFRLPYRQKFGIFFLVVIW